MTKGHSGKILANEDDNTIVKSYDMTTKYTLLSHFHSLINHSLINKACQNVFISPTQENIYHIGNRNGRTLTQGRNCRSQAFLGQGLTKPLI